jgi:hypothetical protein
MVNTFLLEPDFRASARRLDRARLGKQRVEAYQILIVLRHLRFLARYFNLPQFPVDEDRPVEEREAWIDLVLKTFKQTQTAIHIRGDVIVEIPLGQALPHRIKSGHQLLQDEHGQVYEVKGKRRVVVSSGPWYDYVLPGEDFIHRPRRHPVIRMWLGFETALMDYINAHIEVWIEREYVNNMQTYDVPLDYPRPSWSYSEQIMNEFRSTLVQRELERYEDLWYSYQPDCVEAFVRDDLARFEEIRAMDPQQIDVHASLLQLGPGRFPEYSWP